MCPRLIRFSEIYFIQKNIFFSSFLADGNVGESCLRSAVVPLISNEQCNTYYESGELRNGMMCAGYELGGIDSCKGDSGGPLICPDKDRHYIYGVVSWGQGCGQERKPGVYSEVRHYLQWINDNIAYM